MAFSSCFKGLVLVYLPAFVPCWFGVVIFVLLWAVCEQLSSIYILNRFLFCAYCKVYQFMLGYKFVSYVVFLLFVFADLIISSIQYVVCGASSMWYTGCPHILGAMPPHTGSHAPHTGSHILDAPGHILTGSLVYVALCIYISQSVLPYLVAV